MKTGTKIAIGAISLITVGTALYFFVFKKKKTVQDGKADAPAKDVMLEKIKSIMIVPTETQESKDKFIAVLNKMSDSEIKDTYFMSIAYKDGQELSDDLKKSMEEISKKYNIFT